MYGGVLKEYKGFIVISYKAQQIGAWTGCLVPGYSCSPYLSQHLLALLLNTVLIKHFFKELKFYIEGNSQEQSHYNTLFRSLATFLTEYSIP